MATKTWIGGAVAVAQVTEWVFGGTWEADDEITITIGNKTVSLAAGATAVDDITDDVLAALVAATEPEFTEITWTKSGTDTIVGTAVAAGKPFLATFATAESDGGAADDQEIDGGASSTGTNTTNCTGPNHVDNAQNWDGGLPADGDDVVFANSEIDALYALDQSAITPASVRFDQSYTGRVGLPVYNETNGYYEYRERYLRYGNAGDSTNMMVTVGSGQGEGSSRILFDNGDGQATVHVINSGSPETGAIAAFFWKGTHASNVFSITKGRAAVTYYPAETSVIATLNVGYQQNIAGDAELYLGDGLTLGVVNQSGGVLTTQDNITTANVTDGELIHLAGTMGTLNLDGGAVRYRSAGTLTTANIGSGGNLDFRQDMRARTVTNINLYEGFEYHDPVGTVTPTNGFDFHRCTPSDGTFDVVSHRTLTPSAI
jgi:hypothetical protein